MPAKCNIPPTERQALFDLFHSGLTPEEEAQAVRIFDQYLFYQPKGRHRLCLCTSCGNLWRETLSEAKGRHGWRHNEATSCPQCGARVTMKCIGRFGKYGRYPSLHEEHNLVVFRPAADGGLLVSAGRIVVDYQPGIFDGWLGDEADLFPVPTLDYWERRRYYMAPGRLASWKRHSGIYKGPWGYPVYDETPWAATVSAGEPNPTDSIYTRQPDGGSYRIIGWEALAETSMRYSAVDQYFALDADLHRDVVSYLAHYTRRPQLEMLVKLGHSWVVDQLLDYDRLNGKLLDWRATRPDRFFRLPKQAYRSWSQAGGSQGSLSVYQLAGRNISMDKLLEVPGIMSIPADLMRTVCRLADQYQIPLLHLLNYLRGEGRARTWTDYIDMGRQIGLDFGREDVLLPKKLMERHDMAARQIYLTTHADEIKAYQRRRKALERLYGFAYGGYLIRAPLDAQEIIQEGKVLQHCVGGYADRHMRGVLAILFLRSEKNPDKPLCTIEMNGVHLVQIHGYKNDRGGPDPMKAYAAILDQWLPWVKAGSQRDQQGRPVLPEKVKVKTA